MPDSPPPPTIFDLRLVWCFTVVAEYLHFGRAAEALHTTQPSLSRQIHRLEEQLGARLFERTPQGNHLTPAGEVFLPLANALLRSADQAAARTRAAARPSRINIGYTPGIIVTPAVRELRHRHPDADVRTLHLAGDEPRPALLDHRVDAVVARLPFPNDGLDVTKLYDEPRVLVVSLDHRLAGKESVTLDDIADEPLPQVRGADPLVSAFWRIDPRPDGRPAPDGPVAETVEDKFELIAAGQAVTISTHVHTHTLRPDLTTVPLEGVEPSHVVLATRTHERNGLVTAFRTYARAHLTGGDPADPESAPPSWSAE
ncbi:LysR family transcriptional regulator [Streptomyces lunaelactis]|uniref:LysR family transcriptional regulator n=1 Tax=Streptomyces lunaelactis TaxID=1535768 RepID=UPI0015845103|nr:LysR family transcriptional regulator [Streptomyces lunaelactis]NUL05716.1 LysR family transcriptional regulator [Streptomyces lunaelactis]